MRNSRILQAIQQNAAKWLIWLSCFVGWSCLASGPPPVITVQPTNQVVSLLGIASFSVGASSGTTMSYQWYQNGNAILGANSSTYTILSVLSLSVGTYTVKVSNSGGSVMSAPATLSLTPYPGIVTAPVNQTVTQGQTASFSVVVSGSTPLAYQWSLNGAALPGATTSALVLTNVQASQAGNYTVVVSNPYGTANAAASLTVYAPPGIITPPQSQTVYLGQQVTFTVTASGSTPLAYQWGFNGTALPGATTSALTLTNVQSSQAGNYKVVVSNAYGTTNATASLSLAIPAGIATPPQSQTAILGSKVTFTVVASGSTPLYYQWSFNGTALSGATSSSLVLRNVQASQAGGYSVSVNNTWGSAVSLPANLTVIVPPQIVTQPVGQTVVQYQPAALQVVANGTLPLSYQWQLNGVALAGATSSVLVLTNTLTSQSGNYTVSVQNSGGSVTSTAATVTVTNPPSSLSQPASGGVASAGFTFQLSLPVGSTYVIQATTDLQNWTPILTNTAATVPVVVTDPDASNYPARFYRALVP